MAAATSGDCRLSKTFLPTLSSDCQQIITQFQQLSLREQKIIYLVTGEIILDGDKNLVSSCDESNEQPSKDGNNNCSIRDEESQDNFFDLDLYNKVRNLISKASEQTPKMISRLLTMYENEKSKNNIAAASGAGAIYRPNSSFAHVVGNGNTSGGGANYSCGSFYRNSSFAPPVSASASGANLNSNSGTATANYTSTSGANLGRNSTFTPITPTFVPAATVYAKNLSNSGNSSCATTTNGSNFNSKSSSFVDFVPISATTANINSTGTTHNSKNPPTPTTSSYFNGSSTTQTQPQPKSSHPVLSKTPYSDQPGLDTFLSKQSKAAPKRRAAKSFTFKDTSGKTNSNSTRVRMSDESLFLPVVRTPPITKPKTPVVDLEVEEFNDMFVEK